MKAAVFIFVVVLVLGAQVAACSDCHAKGGVYLSRAWVCIKQGSVIR